MYETACARLPYYTLGHASQTLEEFIEVLTGNDIALLVDVRTFPRSRHNPQFNQASLPEELARHGIDYRHLPDLGGRRGVQPGVAEATNAGWENDGFHHYADWALQAEFARALMQLRELGQQQRCAIMCAEAVWWRCHRRIIADYLLAAGEQVLHIIGDRVTPAQLTPFARVQADNRIVYPAAGS